jgi:hypothetical protein
MDAHPFLLQSASTSHKCQALSPVQYLSCLLMVRSEVSCVTKISGRFIENFPSFETNFRQICKVIDYFNTGVVGLYYMAATPHSEFRATKYCNELMDVNVLQFTVEEHAVICCKSW